MTKKWKFSHLDISDQFFRSHHNSWCDVGFVVDSAVQQPHIYSVSDILGPKSPGHRKYATVSCCEEIMWFGKKLNNDDIIL